MNHIRRFAGICSLALRLFTYWKVVGLWSLVLGIWLGQPLWLVIATTIGIMLVAYKFWEESQPSLKTLKMEYLEILEETKNEDRF